MGKKKTPKAKEPIKLRYKKLANGNTSLYLDCYRNGQRTYEFLHLYLVPEQTLPDTIANKNTLQAAMAIKAERIHELINGEAGLTTATKTKGKIRLSDWVTEIGKRKTKAGKKTEPHYHGAALYVLDTKGGKNIMLKDVNRDFCLRFLETLANGKVHKYAHGIPVKTDKNLSQDTQALYTITLSSALNEAVRDGIIKSNPMEEISTEDKPRQSDSKREFLSPKELRQLVAAPCNCPDLKQAFIFACFCGLRISDLRGLTWEKIRDDAPQKFIYLRMDKTKRTLTVPLSNAALQWLPKRGKAGGKEKVFPGIPQKAGSVKQYMDWWVRKAGLDYKRITFHVSRHTFATMELTQGADLYTVSKLLGHTSVSTTEIYAKIVDKKKEQAVNLLDGILDKPNDQKQAGKEAKQ